MNFCLPQAGDQAQQMNTMNLMMPVMTLVFADSGIPYDPLKKEDPDVTLPARERQIGGLGIFMTKRIMDETEYEYRDGKNILTLRKNF